MAPKYYYSTDLDVPVEDNIHTQEQREELSMRDEYYESDQFLDWEDDLD